MTIGSPPREYVDGGLGYNNPVRCLIDEVTHIWPGRETGCIVSVGTGVPVSKDVGTKIIPLFETLTDIATDTEQVAREIRTEMRLRYPQQNVYFRFNVRDGLAQVGLEEWKALSRTITVTQDYMREEWEQVDLCASRIHNPTGT